MNNEQYRKHLILKEYAVLKAQREDAIANYCTLLTKLTKVTQNISPTPGHGGDSGYDEKVFELAEKYFTIFDIDAHIDHIRDAVNSLPITECFVIREFYFQKRNAKEIADLLERTPRTIFNLRNAALDKLKI